MSKKYAQNIGGKKCTSIEKFMMKCCRKRKESLNVVKMPLAGLIEMAKRGEITDSKTLAGLLLAEKALG